MPRLIYSPAARRDIQDIAEWIGGDSLEAALRVLDEIDSVLALILNFSEIGQSVEHIQPGLRRITQGKYVIYYSRSDKEIKLKRVLHGSRDMDRLFE